MDLSAAAVTAAAVTADARAEFIVDDVMSPRWQPDPIGYDCILVNEVLNMCEAPAAFLTRVRGLLQSDGTLLVSAWRHRGDRQLWKLVHHLFREVDSIDLRSSTSTLAPRGWRARAAGGEVVASQFESSGTADSVELAIRETRPNSRSLGTLVTELFANLHLVRLLAARDIQAKYKQSFLGPVWPIAQPIITAVMFVVVFHRIVGVQTDPVPYLLFAFVGAAVWSFVSSAVPTASSSLVNHRWVVSRVHFSRMALPASAVLSSSVGLGISVVVLIPLLVVYGRAPGWGVVTLPVCVVWALAVALGPALSFWQSTCRSVTSAGWCRI